MRVFDRGSRRCWKKGTFGQAVLGKGIHFVHLAKRQFGNMYVVFSSLLYQPRLLPRHRHGCSPTDYLQQYRTTYKGLNRANDNHDDRIVHPVNPHCFRGCSSKAESSDKLEAIQRSPGDLHTPSTVYLSDSRSVGPAISSVCDCDELHLISLY